MIDTAKNHKPRAALKAAGIIFLLTFVAVGIFSFKACARTKLDTYHWDRELTGDWKEFDKLVKEQKHEAASKWLEKTLKTARDANRTEEWVRCLIKYTQLRISLHGYETAVRYLKEQEWPSDFLSGTVLNLYYANTLLTYAHSYSWEIRKREKVDSKDPLDLKAWKWEQILTEAQNALHKVWTNREQLGKYPAAYLTEYITPNNFPVHIRPTLRDALSYLRVESMGNSADWSPEHSNGIYRLDVASLLDNSKSRMWDEVSLTNPDIHPLLKISFILRDLELWHADNDEVEAALEARLTRMRTLHSHFTNNSDRETVKTDLRKQLDRVKDFDWWSMGMAQLAEFILTESVPDALIRARNIVELGYKKKPESIGSQKCLHIMKSIESLDFSLTGMICDGAGKRSIQITHKNMDKLYFRAYTVDILDKIAKTKDYSLYPDYREIEILLASGTPTHTWSSNIPATPDYRAHATYVTPPMTKSSLYVVLASAREDFAKKDNKVVGINTVVSDLVLTIRQGGGKLEVTVLSGATGDGVSNAEVLLYRYDWQKGHTLKSTKRTDETGMVVFSTPPTNNSYFLVAKKNREITWDPSYINFYPQGQPGETTSAFIFTDRSIYRPQQKIYWKVIAYRGQQDKADYKVFSNHSANVELIDPNRESVESNVTTTNEFGSVAGEFMIPSGRLLGRWSIRYLGNAIPIQVEEYKRPTFEVKFTDPKTALRLNKPAEIEGNVKYYFGLPVTNGEVNWRVTREPVYPWWWGWYWHGSYGGGSSTKQTIAVGKTTLKEDGSYTFTFTPEADERAGTNTKGITYRYAVTADVTDEGGETRSASKSFRLGFVSVEAAARLDANFILANKKFDMAITRTSLDGVPKAGTGSYRLTALRGPDKTLLPADNPKIVPAENSDEKKFATPGDFLRPRWESGHSAESVIRGWQDGAEKASGNLMHNDKGEAKIELPALPSGAYRLKYRTNDEFGAEYEMTKEFFVAGEKSGITLPALLMVEKNSVNVGGKARIFVLSGLPHQRMTYEIYHNGRLKKREYLNSDKSPNLIEIPITETERGGFGVTVSLLRDHQFMNYSQTVFVPWDNKEVKISFSTFRDKLKPGQNEKWTVKVTGPSGEDTAVKTAELLAYMYDRSLDAFVAHNPRRPIGIFPNRTSIIWTRSNLGTAHMCWNQNYNFNRLPPSPILNGDSLKNISGYGIGGPGYRGAGYGYGGGEGYNDAPYERMAGAKSMLAKQGLREAIPMSEESIIKGAGKRKGESESELDYLRKQPGQPEPEIQMRTDFSETAFWQPHLLTDKDGSASIEFSVPDSVTAWNIWVHAITKDLKSGSINQTARTVKELMVRPYLPRFLREGDKAEIKVVVNNASDRTLKGHLNFDIIDPQTGKSIVEAFN